ncbi:MAG: integrase [Mucilaginibacter sp.]|nr:integrase [Mucilaginibacter sp.]
MRTVNTFGLQFLIRPDKLKDGKAPIYARITVNREIIHLGLKQYIEPRSWDVRRGFGKGTRDEVRALNNYLEDVRTEIGQCYRELQLKKLPITAEAIKNTFLRTEEVEHTLGHLFTYHNKTAAHQLSPNTLSHYETSQKYLRSFIKEQYHKNDLHIKDVNFKFLTDFEVFLRSLKPRDHQKPIGNTGAMTHLIRLKKMINMAINMEWINTSPFKNYKIKIRHEERAHLTKEELYRMEKKVFDLYRLEYVRDIFVFCCYTGLAYVDAMNLTQEQVIKGIDGELWIKTYRQKTKIPVNTPLLPKAVSYIIKYQSDHRAVSSNKLFPVISNQKMNSYLKEIAYLCRIKKNLTFHIARHTFATTVTLSNGVPIETVSKMLGHIKMGTTQIYARVVEQKISDDMAQLKKRLASTDTRR